MSAAWAWRGTPVTHIRKRVQSGGFGAKEQCIFDVREKRHPKD